jgi:hypothetical protein
MPRIRDLIVPTVSADSPADFATAATAFAALSLNSALIFC